MIVSNKADPLMKVQDAETHWRSVGLCQSVQMCNPTATWIMRAIQYARVEVQIKDGTVTCYAWRTKPGKENRIKVFKELIGEAAIEFGNPKSLSFTSAVEFGSQAFTVMAYAHAYWLREEQPAQFTYLLI